jgi:ABC-type uncharacterized transport system permease subunit
MAFQAKTTRALPIGLLITGILFMGINFLLIYISDYWLPKLMIVGILLSFLGLGMTLFPPADVHIPDKKKYFSETIKHSKKLHVVVWILSLLGGIAVTIWYLQFVDWMS